jgi:hypothetical protein
MGESGDLVRLLKNRKSANNSQLGKIFELCGGSAVALTS